MLTSFILICDNFIMRYDPSIKTAAQALRKQGLSLNQIAEALKLPSTTVHLWTRNIKLTKDQLDNLHNRVLTALQKGRLTAQSQKTNQRLKNLNIFLNKGILDLGVLSKRDLFITGIALYWAEGFKNRHEHRLGFCNSDPDMIRLYIRFLKENLKVKNKDLTARLTLNIAYKNQTTEIETYWSNEIDIPASQFTKPFFQNTVWKKEIISDNLYKGVLRIHVKKSSTMLAYMKGLMQGMSTQK